MFFRNTTGPVRPGNAFALIFLLSLPLLLLMGTDHGRAASPGPEGQAAPGREAASGCLECHEGIEPIRGPGSEMMERILELGKAKGDPDGCVVCHGGDSHASAKEDAHGGGQFYPDPGSPWINGRTCGQCHREHVSAQWNSLMTSEAGIIQGAAWGFGAMTGYEHRWGNFATRNPADKNDRLGSEIYRDYMEELGALEPQVFPGELSALPDAPRDLDTLADRPELSVFTYLRSECLRCHLAVRGRRTRGDYRGMGCSACHVPYGNEGFYEGGDQSIPRDKPGHMLVHAIQGTRKTRVAVHDASYSGIPAETCTTCHDRGKRIGVSFQGLMESEYHTPYTEEGEDQPALHGKHYLALTEDVHYTKGMLCQDCHSSLDVHGDRFIRGATLAQVEIECSDCHGTPQAYPWELPLGYWEEFGRSLKDSPPRGVTFELESYDKMGTIYPPADGYLLTARGNAMPNVVRRGGRVVVHSASGRDLEFTLLKDAAAHGEIGTEAGVAMKAIELHLQKMECYSCHSAWAPQCYGCHIKIDYSKGKKSFDWVEAAGRHAGPEYRNSNRETGYETYIPGKVEEGRSYLRWEEPALGINGEGRVSPIIPGCQTTVTVIGEDGRAIIANHIFRTPPNSEGAGPEGQLAMDMSPAQPHTTGSVRSCESCHQSPKALGYGISGGKLYRPPNQPLTVDLETPDGTVLPRDTRRQLEEIPGLEADWSRFVTEQGRQLQTVGHHFKLSRPLNNEERAHMQRQGICLSCHEEIPDESLAVSILHHLADYAGKLPKTSPEHSSLVKKVLFIAGWTQITLGGLAGLALSAGFFWLVRRMRRGTRSLPE